MTVDKYLKQYWDFRESINADLEHIDDIKQMAASVGGIDYSRDKVTGSGYYTGATYEKMIDNAVDRVRYVQERINKHLDTMKQVEDIIDNSDLTEKERTVIRRRFLSHMSTETVAYTMEYSERRIQEIQKNAMRKLQKYEINAV